MQVADQMLTFVSLSWPKNLKLVKLMVMGNRTWGLFFLPRKSLDYTNYYMMLMEQCDKTVVKAVAIATMLDEDWTVICLVTWLHYFFAFKSDTITAKTISELKCFKKQKIDKYLANEESGFGFYGVDLGHVSKTNVGKEFGFFWDEKDYTNQNLLTTLSPYSLFLSHDVNRPDWEQNC